MNQYKRHMYECESTMEWVEAADLTSRCSNHGMHTLHDDDDDDDDDGDDGANLLHMVLWASFIAPGTN